MKLFLSLLALLSFGVQANDCASDAKKFCSGIEPGKGQLARCLSDYETSLSAKCKVELKEYKANTGKKNPCFEDLAEFCADLPSDPLNYEYCLIRHESRLSPRCAADFKNKKGRIITRNLCAQDIANTCYAELSKPEGAVNHCLIRNKTKLSGFCQKNIDAKIIGMKKKNPCYVDTEKFCPTVFKFLDIHDCLTKKGPSLSPDCKKAVDVENGKMSRNPCYRDLRNHCVPGLNPKQQDECLTLNDEHLSRACKSFRVEEKSKIENMVKFCENDRLTYCKDVPMKDGQVTKCLRKNKDKVSTLCKKLL